MSKEKIWYFSNTISAPPRYTKERNRTLNEMIPIKTHPKKTHLSVFLINISSVVAASLRYLRMHQKGTPSSMPKNIGLVTRIIFCFIRRVIPEWIWWNKYTINSSYKIFICKLINHLIKERGKRRWKSPKRKSKRTRENRTTENPTYFWSIVKYENIELIYSNLKIEYK